jgi:hypothetical protein
MLSATNGRGGINMFKSQAKRNVLVFNHCKKTRSARRQEKQPAILYIRFDSFVWLIKCKGKKKKEL